MGYSLNMDYNLLCKHIRGGVDLKAINDILVDISNQYEQKLHVVGESR
jgi:hypothetical protein